VDNPVCQGFFAHTSLATTLEGLPLGVLAQQTWVRDEQTSSSPVQGQVTVEVGARPGQKPRQAACQVYYQRVKLRPPRRPSAQHPKLTPVVLWAILIRERFSGP
jgi:hypothetical protein